jgi:uncharacterized repeat protein (TIGR01451 family)
MSDRPSRQQLVVAQHRSNLPFMLGAIACGCAGFAMVWALGLGRTSRGSGDEGPVSLPVVTVLSPVEEISEPAERAPGLQQTMATEPAAELQPQPVAPRPEVPASAPEDRYANRTVSHETAVPAGPTATERFSRFGPAADPSPSFVMTVGAVEAAGNRDLDDLASPASPTPETVPTGPESETPLPDNVPLPLADSEPLADALPLPEDSGDLAAPVSQDNAPAETAADDTPPSPPAPVAPPAATEDPMPMRVVGNPLRGSAMAVPPSPPPPAKQVSAAVPFAAAPPMGPGPGESARSKDTAATTSTTGSGSTGQGRPGPVQLEGIQTPQLTVEKRGPREVQVGKAARYEVLVRNVGSAVAHECMLRDAVPYGTTLVATTPPASPSHPASADAASDLVWALGSIPPGGTARVAMEVMPTLEGDVGSVASVTFRADASIRSRATKPDLRLVVTEPKPVLIGKDVKMAITITNPGTGVATGVVLEGALPDGLSHSMGRELEFDVGQLQPGASRTIDLVLGSTGPGVHGMRLLARGDGRLEVEQMIRVEVTAPTLEIAAEMPARRFLQRPATCVISMANTGTAPAKSVEMAAQLPAGVKFVRANNAGYYDERSHRVLWNLEELPPGETGTVEMVVMPVDLGPQKIVAAARSADGLSDQIGHTIEVEGLAALFFELTDSEDPIEIDGLTEYIVRVRNQGTKAASGVRLTATLLGNLLPVEAKGPAAHRIDNLTVSFEPLARLSPAEEAVFRVRVRGEREGDQRVQVQLTSDDHPSPITKEETTRVYADR